MRECEIKRPLREGELQLVRDLVSAWWPARINHEEKTIGTIHLPNGSSYRVGWIPNYGVVSNFATTNGSWVFLVECCPAGTIFEPIKEETDL